MAGFQTVLEGLGKVKSLLEVPFTDPVCQAAEVSTLLGKTMNCASEYLSNVKEQGAVAMSKKDKVSDLAEQFAEFTREIIEPNRQEQIKQLRLNAGRSANPLQEVLQNYFKVVVMVLNEKIGLYRDPAAKPLMAAAAPTEIPLRRGTDVHGNTFAGGVMTAHGGRGRGGLDVIRPGTDVRPRNDDVQVEILPPKPKPSPPKPKKDEDTKK